MLHLQIERSVELLFFLEDDLVSEQDGGIPQHAEVEVLYACMEQAILHQKSYNLCERLVILYPGLASQTKCFQRKCEFFAFHLACAYRRETFSDVSHKV